MRKFDTKIQYLKYKVLREVARYGFEDNLDAAYYEIPKDVYKRQLQLSAATPTMPPRWMRS